MELNWLARPQLWKWCRRMPHPTT